jgi:very-short-patch-repair endonuclease
MGRWIVDFACFDPKIVIEVDDKSHDYRDERERSAFIESLGFRILRFDNIDVAQQIDAIVRFITAEVKRVASYPPGVRVGRPPHRLRRDSPLRGER